MESNKNISSKVYNVIILDKSGSMSSIARQAVDGVNETLGSIRVSREKHPEQEQFVTLVAFCGCELKRIIDRQPIEQVKNLNYGDYRPCCMTPLYDAVGSTITTLHELIADDPHNVASVTIITDGYENASREFRRQDIKALIERYTKEGWLFAYIGADHDVHSVAVSLSINNALEFEKSEEGTQRMFNRFNNSRSNWSDAMYNCMAAPMSSSERREAMRKANEDFFEDEA
ncbi:MAG: VWA domain-containing protein [Muribaculaceae bacterium]|nr:VWA domain-containing protein [Muribaculaceae bacterium]